MMLVMPPFPGLAKADCGTTTPENNQYCIIFARLNQSLALAAKTAKEIQVAYALGKRSLAVHHELSVAGEGTLQTLQNL